MIGTKTREYERIANTSTPLHLSRRVQGGLLVLRGADDVDWYVAVGAGAVGVEETQTHAHPGGECIRDRRDDAPPVLRNESIDSGEAMHGGRQLFERDIVVANERALFCS